MFFPERITQICESDLVLEVGPGASPHPRSNVFLDKKFASEEEELAQCGYNSSEFDRSKVVFYEGGRFPFEDNEFDYVICSHVLEHIDELELPFFVSELCRVAKKGYLEFPTIYYDYIYNIPEHLTLLLKTEEGIYYISKERTGLSVFNKITSFFYASAFKGHVINVEPLKNYYFQGFEWSGKISVIKAEHINDVTLGESDFVNIPSMKNESLNNNVKFNELSFNDCLKLLAFKIFKKTKQIVTKFN